MNRTDPLSPAKRIYLDHAATSFPKPPAVLDAMVRFANEIGANAGRGTYRESLESTHVLDRCRRSLAKLLNAPVPEQIVFTQNCTDALNLAIHGLTDLAGNNHFICTAMDHNAVLRPMHELAALGRARVTVVRADQRTGQVDPDDIRAAITPDTKLIAVPHASNVTGTILPIAEIAAIAKAAGVPLLIDAAQTAGHLPIDVQALGIDLLAMPGHKGLLGPLGTGALFMRSGMERSLRPQRAGGTGSQSDSLLQPTTMPDRFEVGSQNVIGLAGLSAGVEWLLVRGVDSIRQHDLNLSQLFRERLASSGAITLFGPRTTDEGVGVFSVAVHGFEPAELAMALEAHFGILVRAGLHCSPLAHQALGTASRGGTVRVSFGASTETEDVECAAASLLELALHARK